MFNSDLGISSRGNSGTIHRNEAWYCSHYRNLATRLLSDAEERSFSDRTKEIYWNLFQLVSKWAKKINENGQTLPPVKEEEWI